MKIIWSIPVWGERLSSSSRGDLVRALRLIEALRADGHDVRVVENAETRSADLIVSGYRGLVRRVLPQNIALVLRDVSRWMHARVHGRRVAVEAQAQDADVIVETQVNFAGSGALVARTTGLPLILDDCSPSSEEAILGAGLPRLAHYVLKRQAQVASVVVATSCVLRERLVEEGVPPDKLRIVPNGVDVTAYDSVDRDAVRKRLGLADRCVFGFAGSFLPWHQVELLVEALAQLVSDHSVHLLLIGEGPTRDASLDTCRRLGVSSRVTALGAVAPSQVPELICSFDVGVLPGSNDFGHPMKLMEYAAAGLASVAPNLVPVREVLEDGVTGLLFPPGDVNALTLALKRLATDAGLRRHLGERARRQVAEGASWTGRARALLSGVNLVAARGRNQFISAT